MHQWYYTLEKCTIAYVDTQSSKSGAVTCCMTPEAEHGLHPQHPSALKSIVLDISTDGIA